MVVGHVHSPRGILIDKFGQEINDVRVLFSDTRFSSPPLLLKSLYLIYQCNFFKCVPVHGEALVHVRAISLLCTYFSQNVL